MRRAIYAGSFDPATMGHIWMIKEGARLFDELIVVIGDNPEKTYMFSEEERLHILQVCTESIPNVSIKFLRKKYLADFAKYEAAYYLLRGIRSSSDYAYEKIMRYINEDLHPALVTVFLIPPKEYVEVSSSLIKGLVGPEGWESVTARYLPAVAHTMLKEKVK